MRIEAWDSKGPIDCEMTSPPPIGLRIVTTDLADAHNAALLKQAMEYTKSQSRPQSVFSRYAT